MACLCKFPGTMLGGIVKRSLALACPFAIAKAFGLDAATRPPEYFHRHSMAGPVGMRRPGTVSLTASDS